MIRNPAERQAARARGGQAAIDAARGWRASEHFDSEKAIRLFRETVNEIYGGNPIG